jgi:hypothetical protein
MSKIPSKGLTLPEPSHPFARWSGGAAAVGVWALIVQSFPEPLNKVGAILTPGVGYIVGNALQVTIDFFLNKSLKKWHAQDLVDDTKKIDNLNQELLFAKENGANSEVISLIEVSITAAHREKIMLVSSGIIKRPRASAKL